MGRSLYRNPSMGPWPRVLPVISVYPRTNFLFRISFFEFLHPPWTHWPLSKVERHILKSHVHVERYRKEWGRGNDVIEQSILEKWRTDRNSVVTSDLLRTFPSHWQTALSTNQSSSGKATSQYPVYCQEETVTAFTIPNDLPRREGYVQ